MVEGTARNTVDGRARGGCRTITEACPRGDTEKEWSWPRRRRGCDCGVGNNARLDREVWGSAVTHDGVKAGTAKCWLLCRGRRRIPGEEEDALKCWGVLGRVACGRASHKRVGWVALPGGEVISCLQRGAGSQRRRRSSE